MGYGGGVTGYGGWGGPEGDVDEGGAEEDREDDEEEDHSFHLRDGDRTGLESVGLASMLVRVGTFEGIAEFIAQITEDLEAEGGED